MKQHAPVERCPRTCAEDDARLVEAGAVGLADAAVVATATAHVEAVSCGVHAALAREQHAGGGKRQGGVTLERVDQRRQPPRPGHLVVVEQCDVGAVGAGDAVIHGGGEAVVGGQRVPLGAVCLCDRARAVPRSARRRRSPAQGRASGRNCFQARAEQGFAIQVRDDGDRPRRSRRNHARPQARSSAPPPAASSARSNPAYSDGHPQLDGTGTQVRNFDERAFSQAQSEEPQNPADYWATLLTDDLVYRFEMGLRRTPCGHESVEAELRRSRAAQWTAR